MTLAESLHFKMKMRAKYKRTFMKIVALIVGCWLILYILLHDDVTIIKAKTDIPSRQSSILTGSWLEMTSYRISNEHICSGLKNLTFIVVVHSAIENFNKRRGIRQTWGYSQNYRGFNMRTAFFLGIPADDKLQSLIDFENSQYNDIVQGNFLDTYRNITYKGVMVFRWVNDFCNNAEMVLKVDDDVYVNMFELVNSRVISLRKAPKRLTCEVVHNARIRRKDNKWALSSNELPGQKYYPTYCRGYFVLMTSDLVKLILENVAKHPYFWIDDVYIFGFLMQSIGARFLKDNARIANGVHDCNLSYFRKKGVPSDCCMNIRESRYMTEIWLNTLMKYRKNPLLSEYIFKSWFADVDSTVINRNTSIRGKSLAKFKKYKQ